MSTCGLVSRNRHPGLQWDDPQPGPTDETMRGGREMLGCKASFVSVGDM